jgi:DNA-binding NarL/FixJ family response regulator
VRGFVPKSAPITVLTDALELVLAGDIYFPSSFGGQQPPRPQPVSSLLRGRRISPRQQEVLELMVAGMSNADIADRLGIKESTVKNHVQGIFRSFNVGSRTQAVVAAVRAGLEPPPLGGRHEFP